jgi:Flp pilus assembly pilin Flp
MWWLVAAIAAIDVVWMASGGFRLNLVGALPALLTTAALLGARRFLRTRGPDRPALALVEGTAQLIASFAVCGVLSYLAFATDRPMVDRELAALDALCGFDWPRFVGWVQGHPLIDRLLVYVYHAVVLELIALVVLLGVVRPERIRELIATSIIALLITLVIAGLAPAADAYLYWKVTHPELIDELPIGDHLALRAGVLREIDLGHLQGLVTFPSYHVVLALLFVWAARGITWLLPVSLAFNLVMVVSTLSAGGHYMIDAPGGLAVTVVAILLHRAATRALAPERTRHPASWGFAMRKHFGAALADRSGATAMEYGLIVSMIALALVVALTAAGSQIGNVLNTIATDLQNSPAA